MNIIKTFRISKTETFLKFEVNSIPPSRSVDQETRYSNGRSELIYRRDAPPELAAYRHLARESTLARAQRSIAYSDANAMHEQLQNVRGVAL